MKNNPLVSVIIPCYNYGHFIQETIESVLNQTYKNWEIVIADDGSEKSTLGVLESLKDSIDRLKVIYLKNGGPSRARNKAIEIADGKYILPLDADDRIGVTYLEKAIEILESKENFGIVYCEAEFFGAINEKWNLPDYSFPEILLGNCIFVSGFFRKNDWIKVGGYDESFMDEWEDYDFWLKIIELGRKVYRIPEVLFYYRRGHVSRNTRQPNEWFELYKKIYTNHSDLYKRNIDVLIKRHSDAIALEYELNKEIQAKDHEIQSKDQEINYLRKSWSFRVGYFMIHPWKIPYAIWKRLLG